MVKRNACSSDKTRQNANFRGNPLFQSYDQYKTNKSFTCCQLGSCRRMSCFAQCDFRGWLFMKTKDQLTIVTSTIRPTDINSDLYIGLH